MPVLTEEQALKVFSALQDFTNLGDRPFACRACGKTWACGAWVLIWCGGCGKQAWSHQTQLRALWCVGCEGRWQDRDPRRALEQFSGLGFWDALALFEAPEQRALARLRWELKGLVKRARALLQSRILKAHCGDITSWPRY